MHNMVVDTYALQHPEDYCKSAKSYAAHLVGLCCGIEHSGDQKLYWGIPRWLDGPARIDKPSVPTERGRLNIGSVAAARDETYQLAVPEWARDVWSAYQSQHVLARKWLSMIEPTARVV